MKRIKRFSGRRITMKKIILSNVLKLYVLIILVSFSKAEPLNNNTSEEFCSVDPNRIPEILTMISNRTKSNYEQIKLWQGKLDIVTDYAYQGDEAKKVFKEGIKASGEAPKELLEHRETNIDFSLDAENDLLYAGYYSEYEKPLQYIDAENGRSLESKGMLATRKAIITCGYRIDCKESAMQDGIVKKREAVKQMCLKNDSKCGKNPPVYDPRIHLSMGDPIWEFCPRLVDYIKKHGHGKYSVGGFDLRVEERKTGDTCDYRIIMPSRIKNDENYLFHEWLLSGNSGFNTVSFQTTYQNKGNSNKVVLKKEIVKYKQFGKVYVPCYSLEQTFDTNGILNKEQTITFKNQKVNEPIPAETFTYKNLGLKDGDYFIDKIKGKKYKIEDANLVFVADVNK
jgi:hypothetical protein